MIIITTMKTIFYNKHHYHRLFSGKPLTIEMIPRMIHENVNKLIGHLGMVVKKKKRQCHFAHCTMFTNLKLISNNKLLAFFFSVSCFYPFYCVSFYFSKFSLNFNVLYIISYVYAVHFAKCS